MEKKEVSLKIDHMAMREQQEVVEKIVALCKEGGSQDVEAVCFKAYMRLCARLKIASMNGTTAAEVLREHEHWLDAMAKEEEAAMKGRAT